MCEDEKEVYGEEKLEILIVHYGHEQTHTWIEDGEDHHMTPQLRNNVVQSWLEWDPLNKDSM